MDTEAVEEVMAEQAPTRTSCCNNDLSSIAKGKRTKRHRPHSPIPFSVKPRGEYDTTNNNNRCLSPAASSTTTEEVDTARCLILLAQGHLLITPKNHHDSKRKRQDGSAATCMYACKTCSRVFPSFQALGGHRASHKRPKIEKKSAVVFSDEEDFPSPPSMMGPYKKRRMPPPSYLHLANISAANANTTAAAAGSPKPLHSPRIHDCSYCGAEFTSGQALGGHMRRHRSGPISPQSNHAAAPIENSDLDETYKPRNGLPLDLNLPAPEDHENQLSGFDARQQKSPDELALSTANTRTLVDCHY